MQLIQRAAVSEFRERIRVMSFVVLVAIAALCGRLFYLQAYKASYYGQMAEENILRRVYLPSTRGVIHDTRGRVIAANRPSYNVYVVPYAFLRHFDETFPRFAEYLGLGRDERDRLEARLREAADGERRFQQIAVRDDIDRETLAVLETHRDELPGVTVIAVPVRTYPFGELAAHAVGFLNEVSGQDIEDHRGEDYRAGDRIGRSGLERAWESLLRGRRGWVRVDRDYRGIILSSRDEIAHFGPDRRLEPVPGRDMVLTLDMELMRAIDRAFRQRQFRAGAAAVVDVHTGRVLALYSRPSIDPNQMALGLSPQLAREIDENPDRPRIDRSIYETYYPGSTVKPFTALAGLRSGLWDARHIETCTGTIMVGGRHWHCAHGHVHGVVDLHLAIVQSCNIYFCQLARAITLDMIAREATEFGLGHRTGIGINAESAGLVPTREWYQHEFGRFRTGFTMNSAIGQGATRLTVLQLALGYAALANGGDVYVPQIVERIESPDGAVLQEFPPAVRHHIDLNPVDLERVRAGLRGVVAEPHGTAHRAAFIPEVEIAGKTGTAQVSRVARQGEDARRAWYMGRDHAWFAAFAPYQNPEVAIVVLVEHGGSGGDEAAPVAAQVLRDYFTRIRPGEPIPTVRAMREQQEDNAARQRARNRH